MAGSRPTGVSPPEDIEAVDNSGDQVLTQMVPVSRPRTSGERVCSPRAMDTQVDSFFGSPRQAATILAVSFPGEPRKLTSLGGVRHTRAMFRSALGRSSAVVALAALASPWAIAMGVAAHLARHDHASAYHADDHSEELEVALHGHRHTHGTPDHVHTLALARQPPMHPRPSITWTLVNLENIVDRASVSMSSWSDATGPGHGPPSFSPALSVLRI